MTQGFVDFCRRMMRGFRYQGGSKVSVYLDNAATSHPKPEPVYRAVENYLQEVGVSAGRGSYRQAQQAEDIIWSARTNLAQLLGAEKPDRIIFTSCATDAVNLALFGLLGRWDHAIVGGMEHNSVWRTMHELRRRRGVRFSVIPHAEDGSMRIEQIPRLIRRNTRLIVSTHASNVAGTVMPVARLGQLAAEYNLLLVVDAAQTAGCLPIDVQKMGIDLLAFTGHKGLMGPQGTGGLYIREGIDVHPLLYGGTGTQSAWPHQPRALPHRFEAGTLNGPGIAGLGAALEFILQRGVKSIREHEGQLLDYTLRNLPDSQKLSLYGPGTVDRQVAIVSFNIEATTPEEVSYLLDEMFGVMTRAGLHCSPCAHRVLGTSDWGAVRASFGFFNTTEDVDALIEGIETILDEI